MLNTIFGSLSEGVAPSTNSYESISTVTVGGGGSSTISFTSIPSTYTHLQVRGISRSTSALASSFVNFNSDSSANYSWHQLDANGSAATASGGASQTYMLGGIYDNTANIFGCIVLDILDYKDTNKYKTMRLLSGYDANGSGYLNLRSGNWRNTNAVTSIVFTPSAGNFAEYSSFALYGIKGS